MDAPDLAEVLKGLSFIRAGSLCLENDRLLFKLDHKSQERGFVYLWVECTSQSQTVVYVGKAGRTLKSRCDQHQSGFLRSTTGRAHSFRLRAGLAAGKSYELYARKAGVENVLGESAVSMACVEELACIKKFKPQWNGGA